MAAGERGTDRAPHAGRVEAQLGVLGAGRRRRQLALGPRPARRQPGLVEGQLVGGGERVDHPVLHQPAAVVAVAPRRTAPAGGSARRRPRPWPGGPLGCPGPGHRGVEVVLHPDRREAGRRRGPPLELGEEAAPVGRPAGVVVGPPHEGVHDGPVPGPHAREVVHGEGRQQRRAPPHRAGGTARGSQVLAAPCAQVPRPVAAGEPRPLVGRHRQGRHRPIGRRAAERRSTGVEKTLMYAAGPAGEHHRGGDRAPACTEPSGGMPCPPPSADETVIHVLWINAGLSCDGDSVALTAATQPSVEEIALGALPGLPEDRRPLAADRLRVRSGRRRRRLHRVVLQGRPGRAGAVRAGRRGLDPEREDQERGLLVRVRQQPRHRPADDDQRVARPPRPQGAGGAGRRHVRLLRRHPRHGRQPHRRDGRARLPRLGLEVEGRPADRVRPRAAPPTPTTCPRRSSTCSTRPPGRRR